ncbi:MAG: DNA translocase FtsK [Treponema sp.]|nr:DNA translocase FtsK [Treponema sp.]
MEKAENTDSESDETLAAESEDDEEIPDDPFSDVFEEEDTFAFPEEEAIEESEDIEESEEEISEENNDEIEELTKDINIEESDENSSKKAEPLLSKEEYDALNKINEDLLEEKVKEDSETKVDSSVESLEWPTTDEIISRAGISKAEENSLIGESEEENEEESEEKFEEEENNSAEELYEDNSESTEIEEREEDPYTAFDIDEDYQKPAEEEENDSEVYSDANFLEDSEKKTSDTLEADFFDIDMNAENEDESENSADVEDQQIAEMQNLEESFSDDSEDFSEQEEDEETASRSFLDDMVEAQEDDEEYDSGLSDNDEDDFGVTNSTFNIASDIFSDMEEDAREQLEAGKKPARFEEAYQEESEEAEAERESEENDEIEENEIETAKPLERKTIVSEKKEPGHRVQPKKPYIVPTDLLEQYEDDQYWIIDEATKNDAIKLKDTLNQFGISAEIIGIKKGPVVTMFEIAPAPGVKLSKIVSLQDNIALSLAASSVRIVAPIPGKAAVGIETPNKKRSIVSFREIIEQDIPEFKKMAIPVILGKDILGKSQIIDIAKTPHLLIAGATGAGKSVCVNSLILSILYKRSPREVKMILVDPKVVELKLYNDIPHLLTPVITEPKRALQALQYCLCEMERRYALLDGLGVRDITNYNKRVEERNICTEKLPYIVIIIDEFADLMATSGRDLESIVARLTAMSRAVGIHLVLATQRPSVNVITGLIKANIPSRIAFMVSSRTDSNIIIDAVGAEKLLGKGDMLYASAVDPYPVRIQGTFESDNDVENVVNYVKTLGEPEYIDEEIFVDDEEEQAPTMFSEGDDPLYEQALEIVLQSGKASASYIQRRLKIGYNRAARLVEEMEARGIVGPANGSKPREIIHVPS